MPEPGRWVLDSMAGMPDVLPPEDLPPGKLSAADVYAQVEYEGLGFCIYELVAPSRIADEKLSALWEQARGAMREALVELEKQTMQEGSQKRRKKRETRQSSTKVQNNLGAVPAESFENLGGEELEEAEL